MKTETGVLTSESLGQIMKLIDRRPYLDPQVGIHLRSDEELQDLREIYSIYSPRSLYVGLVGSRLGGKMYRSAHALQFHRGVWRVDEAVFNVFIKSLPGRIGTKSGDQLIDVSDIAPSGFPPMSVEELIYDIDLILVPEKPTTQIKHVIWGQKSQTPYDIWQLSPQTIIQKGLYHEIFDNSFRLRL